MVGQFFGPLADKSTKKRERVDLSASKKFSGHFCTFYEISIWNLVYTFDRQCQTSTYNFITIRLLWPTLKPKMGKSCFFFHLWPQPLCRAFRFGTHTYIASVLNCINFRHGWDIFYPWWPQTLSWVSLHWKGFSAFFYMFLDINLKSGKHTVGGITHQVWVSSQSGLCFWRVFQTFFLNVLRH